MHAWPQSPGRHMKHAHVPLLPHVCSARHGMWSLGRCLAAATPHLPQGSMQVDTQFKLPVYIPSQALSRTWNSSDTVEIAMCTMRGDRLHLAMQVKPL